jgi:hypothetical protein
VCLLHPEVSSVTERASECGMAEDKPTKISWPYFGANMDMAREVSKFPQ